MRNKSRRQAWIAVKIDLEKAYDKIDLGFIDDTLVDIGIPK